MPTGVTRPPVKAIYFSFSAAYDLIRFDFCDE